MAYVPCKDPSCVDLGLLYTRGLDTLKARGTKLARNLWAYPADPSNYRAANRNKSHSDQIVIHTAEGYTGGLDTFRDPARNASAHYAVQWDGTVAQMVPEKDIAWHAGGYIGTNDRSVGIEHVGFAYAMQPGTQTEWSKDLLLSSAKLVASSARRYGVPLDRQHIIAHDDVPGGVSLDILDLIHNNSTQCPDLLTYSPDMSDWFFCEVKGLGDRLSPAQKEYFEELSKLSDKSIRIIKFKALKTEPINQPDL